MTGKAKPKDGPTPAFTLEVSWQMTPEMEAANKAYDALARALPQCEHVTEWQAQVKAARAVYLKALRKRDRLWDAQVKAASDNPPGGAVAEDPEPAEGGQAHGG